MASITLRGSSSPGADVECHGVRGSAAMRWASSFERNRSRRRFAGAQRLVEAGKDGLDAGERIRSHVDVGALLAVRASLAAHRPTGS